MFNSHLDLAHFWWGKIASNGGWAIDATCGNGKDCLQLCSLFEGVIGLDIQAEAIEATQSLLGAQNHAYLYAQSHESFPSLAKECPIRLIVYNLGYLPGGDKTVTTQVQSTLKSLKTAVDLLAPGGMISITCYPGHSEGAKEEKAIEAFASQLDPSLWSVCFHQWKNRQDAPSLFLLQKNNFNV